MNEMIGWKTELMGQKTLINSDHSVRCGIDRLVKLTNPGYSILDVGCYHGDVFEYVKDIGVDYVGIDLFQSHINKAKNKYPMANFYVEDLFEMNRRADIVFCSRVLMHIPNFKVAMKKLIDASIKYCILVLPIGDPSLKVEEGPVYFRRYSLEELIDSIPDSYSWNEERSKPYSTVVISK